MTNAELAAAAWNAVRHFDDAPWVHLSKQMKGKLVALAEKYSGGARVDEGDYPPEGFAEKVAELASRQEFFVMGDGDGSAPELVSMGVGEVQSIAEHEDAHIPSPIPEDVDPLKDDLREPAQAERRISNRRGLMDKPGNIENDRRMAAADRRTAK